MHKMLLPTLFVVGLVGCAASPDLPATYALDATRQEGLAIISLTLSGTPLDKVSSYEYRIREVLPRGEVNAVVNHHYASARQHARSVQDDGQDRPFTHAVVVKGPNNIDALDIQDAGKATGRLAALRLLPGDYEFHTWQVREPRPYGETSYGPPQDFSYRFSIKPGVATYIGRLNLNLSERNTQKIVLKDMRNDDLAILRKKYPAIETGLIAFDVGALQP